MNRIAIIASSVLLVLAACAKVTPVEPPGQQEITFTVANLAQATKASAFDPKKTFGTFAYWTPTNWATDGTTHLFMNNEEISNVGGVWAPADPHYWTKSGMISFASYAPYCEAKGTLGFTVAPAYSKDHHFTFTDYTIVDEADVDLMFADDYNNKDCTHTTNTTGEAVVSVDESGQEVNNFKGVPTLFRHALTQVRFTFRQKAYGNTSVDEENSWIEVAHVELLDLHNKNTFTDNTWDLSTAEGEVSYLLLDGENDAAVKIAKASEGNPTLIGNPLIVLPQSLLSVVENEYSYGPQMLKVTYNICTKFKSNDTVQRQDGFTVMVPLGSEDRLTDWEMNQDITYLVTINPFSDDPVSFDPAVADWTIVNGELAVE